MHSPVPSWFDSIIAVEVERTGLFVVYDYVCICVLLNNNVHDSMTKRTGGEKDKRGTLRRAEEEKKKKKHIMLKKTNSVQLYQKRTSSGGHGSDHKGGDGHKHGHSHGGPNKSFDSWSKSGEKADIHSNEPNNPYLWDPTYSPAEETDFDRFVPENRPRNVLPKENSIPKEVILERITKVCRGMERAKTEGKTITATTHLTNDLGLDSLDQVCLCFSVLVHLVYYLFYLFILFTFSHLTTLLIGCKHFGYVEFSLALEDEFDIEIADEEAEQVVTIGDAVDLIADHPKAR
ncbi:acyl carrier protein [Reticulomyxa filosa]|uniref:Acyl carrier protein n=1 Tax=Reticulomyxa filosa TaxID=46433 RepID=X6NWN2_RETFI|nr:acyl carrier protein [Reticulomyxa filosa]|eukprot:ETO30730.1 acyl carrier protein [Reticulomyxa filosa]